MNIIRDVLDNQLLDRKGRPIGRVDGIVATCVPGEQPRLDWIEVGIPTAMRRLHGRLVAPMVRLLERIFGPDIPTSYRIPWSKIRHVGINVTVDLDAEETPLLRREAWVRDRVITRLPFAE